LREALQEELQSLYPRKAFAGFNRVRIKDSTGFKLPSNMKASCRGSGGPAGTGRAGIGIQYEYSVKSGRIPDLNLTPEVRNGIAIWLYRRS
jgi:hypothetical protein